MINITKWIPFIIVVSLFAIIWSSKRTSVTTKSEEIQVEKKVTWEIEKVEQVQKIEKKVSKNRKETKYRRDGTVREVTESTTVDVTQTVSLVNSDTQKAQEKVKVESKLKETTSVASDSKSRYSLSLSYPPTKMFQKSNPQLIEIGIGIRLGNSPIWLESQTNLQLDLKIGIRLEF